MYPAAQKEILAVLPTLSLKKPVKRRLTQPRGRVSPLK